MQGRKAITRDSCKVILVFLISFLLCSLTAAAMLEINVDVVGGASGTEWGGLTQSAWTIDWDTVYANSGTTYTFDLPYIIDIAENNNQSNKLARVHSLYVAVKADPVIELGFDVEALAYDTQFTITVDALNFEGIENPTMEANAEIKIIETDAQTTLTGNFDNSKAYRSYYNNDTFADLIDTPILGKGSVATESSGSQQISGTVSSIHSQWQFTLTGNGRVSGISDYTDTVALVPEPASLLLLGTGGLAVLSRRKI